MILYTLAANVEPWQGITAIAALSGVVVFLFKWAEGRATRHEQALRDAETRHVKELGQRDVREVQIRAECDAKIAALTREHAEALRRDHLDNRAHEDGLRREFTEAVSTISEQTNKSASALTEVLARLHDRFAGPRSRH